METGLIYEAAYETKNNYVQELLDLCDEPPLVAILNTDKYQFSGYAPFILSIRDADAYTAFLRGELIITVAVDPSVIYKRFNEMGFKAEFKDEQQWAIRITNNEYEDFYMMAGQHLFGRIFTEFLSLDWFISELIHRATRIIEGAKE